MKKELKGYLHLYLGCEVIGNNNYCMDAKGYLTGVMNGGINVDEEPYINDLSQVRLILRHLSDIKGLEYDIWASFTPDYTKFGRFAEMEVAAKRTVFLLSKHFDLFGLIESGLAIDKTTLK